MTARSFTAEYIERITLRDSTPIVLRLVTPADKELLRQGFERWSPESRYARFFAAKQHLTEDELRYLCEVDQEAHFALGALGEDGTGLGIARFIRLPDELGEPVTAEAAIAVADEVHGKGLGRILFERLVAAAKERRIESFRCEILGGNASMQALIAKLAPQRTTQVNDGVVSIDFTLGTEEHQRESSMYRAFRAAAEGLLQVTGRRSRH